MARPTKQGIDYFPLDCNFDNDVEMFLIEKNSIGLAVLVTIWQLIYNNEGYYINDNKDLYLLIKKRINVDINEVIDCIYICLSRNIFDFSLHKEYKIITSSGIQKRYFEAAKRKKEVKAIKEYLINQDLELDNVVINSIDVCNNATNVKEEVKVKGNAKEKKTMKQKISFFKEYTLKKIKIAVPKTKTEELEDLIKSFGCFKLKYVIDRWDIYRKDQGKRKYSLANRWNRFYENISIVESIESLNQKIEEEKGKYKDSVKINGGKTQQVDQDFDNKEFLRTL